MKRFDGFFTYWWDAGTGKIWLQADKWNMPFLYVNSLPGGLGSNDIGLDRGQIGSSRVVYFSKVGKKVWLVQPNFRYRASSNNLKEQQSVRESFAESIIAGFTAEEEEDGKVLIDFTAFLLRDAHGVADRLRSMRQGSYTLNEARSGIYLANTRNFPLNSEFESTITFTGGSDAGRFVNSVTPSVEAITLRMHHSLLQLPDSNYKPRRYDIRSGYFGISFFDYSTPITEPIEQLYISRHRLEKKDVNAPRTEAVKPIIYYLDNGTPEPIRSALLDGARWWNQAFEAAGFINAFQVKVLPDDADPMDIQYNMINWVHRSSRGWSYGASITDPRTGEIIKGQVTLGSLRVRQDYLIFTSLISAYETGQPVPEKTRNAAIQRLRQLAAHEVGHTLGLQHNFAASVNNRGSVMDYPHPTLAINEHGEIDFSNVYTNEIGNWDKQAIRYGYQQFVSAAAETSGLQAILAENTAKGYLFIADADARAAGGMHPSAHLWDNGTNPVSELMNTLKVRDKALRNFSEKAIATNTPMAKLEDALVPVYNYHRYQLEAVCKLIGGINYSYNVRGDQQAAPTPITQDVQVNALNAALQCLSPEVLTLPGRIINLIPPRPPMYSGIGELFEKRTGLAFDAMGAAAALSHYELGFLFNVERANRLVELGARTGGMNFRDVLTAIVNKVFITPGNKGLAAQVCLQTQQQVITHLLELAANEKATYQVKADCFEKLQAIRKSALRQTQGSAAFRAHFLYMIERIEHPKEVVLPQPLEIPPGAPIGCDFDDSF